MGRGACHAVIGACCATACRGPSCGAWLRHQTRQLQGLVGHVRGMQPVQAVLSNQQARKASRDWLLMDRSRVSAVLGGGAWLLWIVGLCATSLVGAALLARLINRPLKDLAVAAASVRSGDYVGHRLEENVASREVREVNVGFNRMADQLSQIELDRARMLAGISHDLRTPLARLRLETEMSVRPLS